MVCKYGNIKAYNVRCDNCDIEEIMVFKPIFPYTKNKTNISLNKVPSFYYFIENENALGCESVEKHRFKPIKGITGDQLPKWCPVCGSRLSAISIIVQS